MTDILRQVEELSRQLDSLHSRHMQMTNEMIALEKQLAKLKSSVALSNTNEIISEDIATSIQQEEPAKYVHQVQRDAQENKRRSISSSFHVTQDLEDFIGTNLISKIGILITIIGVFIGAKYAIDKELVSPLIRITSSYAFAASLFFIALRLKPKYENFSSILMGGGLAVTYFITYIAFSFYEMFPQAIAFALMVITTVAAVVIALWYQQKVIALIGQVAAYAIPFLLSDGSGNVVVLFTYISIINIGLLVLSFRKDWKLLYRIAFFLTWLIYAVWVISSDNTFYKFSKGLLFLAITFFTFYVTFLSYKVFKKQMYQVGEILILLINALLFFFLGAYLLQQNYGSHRMLTWFTLLNAVIHFIAGYFIYRLKLADKSVLQFILGLALLFVTITIPIEFDGSWVTMLWTIEATALFYIASVNKRALYLDIALPLVIIALISLLQDWIVSYPYIRSLSLNVFTHPFANINFWLSLFVCACFGYMSFQPIQAEEPASFNTRYFFTKALPVIFLLLVYFTLFNELHLQWDVIIQHTNVYADKMNYALLQTVTLLIFSCLYVAANIEINSRWIKRSGLYTLLLAAAVIANIVMLFKGLYVLGELRDSYLQQSLRSSPSKWLINIRYGCIIALAILWSGAWRATRANTRSSSLEVFISMLFNFTFLSIVCNEFIHWMDLAGYANQYKLGLSIIWGVYALALIFAGIVRRKKHLRIGAMFLFSLTLLKLFFYDLSSLSTISKTIVLLLLGILLLIASFLYNKYKELLFTKDEPRL